MVTGEITLSVITIDSFVEVSILFLTFGWNFLLLVTYLLGTVFVDTLSVKDNWFENQLAISERLSISTQ